MTAAATRAGFLTGDHRAVWAIAGPAIASNLAPAALMLVDTAAIGHTGEVQALGAVALGGSIFGILFWGFGFLRMSTTGFAAQALGAGDRNELGAGMARAALLALALGAALIALQTPLAALAFALLQGSAEVEAQTRAFFDIAIWSAPGVLMVYGVNGWLIGVQDTRASLRLNALMIAINAGLDALFVAGFGWSVQGVAAGTLIASWVAAGVGLGMVRRRLRRLGARPAAAQVFRPAALTRLFRVNRDIFIRTLCQMAAYAFFAAEGARLGDVTVAANAVLNNFIVIMAQTLDGFAHAVEALAGAAIGRRDRAGFDRSVRAAAQWAAGSALAFAAGFALLGGAAVAMLTDLAPVRAAALVYLPWAVAAPLISVWCFLLDGVFIGATRAREMRNAMLAALIVFFAVWAAAVPAWGNHGLWLALQSFMAARALLLLPYYSRLRPN
jgi:MATE family multidrug resistance protein